VLAPPGRNERETKQVPWWRKALDFALSGLRSGFGLFSRTEKNSTVIEPGTVARRQDFREEAELTDHSPTQDQIVKVPEAEAPEKIEAAAEPEIENVAVPQIAAKVDAESGVEAPSIVEQESAPASEAASEPELVEAAPQTEIEVEPAVAASGTDTEFEVEQLEVEPEEESEPEPVVEPETEVELQQEGDVEPAEIADVVTVETEVEQPDTETAQESEPELAVEQEPALEAIASTEDLTPEAAQEPAAASEVGEAPLAVEDQPAAMTSEPVDEVTPEAQSAISDDAAAEAPSPVLEEIAEHVAELPIEAGRSDETIQEPAQEAADTELDIEETSEQLVEPIPEPEGQMIIEESDEGTVEPQMELNRPNPETAADEEQVEVAAVQESATEEPLAATEKTAAPEEPVAAPETVSQEQPAADEPEAEPQEPVVASANHASAVQHPSRPFIKREGESDNSPFSVIVSQVYDGPLDLLLDLIRKQDIDIYDIPIARITAQFLAYVDQLKATDVDVAGEFIYTASLLIHIKSKMLLPRAPSGPEDAAEDPRRELVERLLEHERFKNAAQMLQQKQLLEAATWTNPGVREFREDTGAEPEIAADTVDLVRVFRDILERARNRPVIDVEEDSVTVGQMIQFLSRRLSMEDKPIALRKLLSHSRSERALIAMFLALLELVRLQAILLRQDRAFSEIFIKKHSNFEEVMTQAPTHDDWN
jgi:segregation and condensation protein A